MGFEIRKEDTAFSRDKHSKATKRVELPKHLAFIRKLPSVISGKRPCDACHIRFGSPTHKKQHTPKARKPDDWWVVPMTREEHTRQHSMNEQDFWKEQGLDPHEVAIMLYAMTEEHQRAVDYIESLRSK